MSTISSLRLGVSLLALLMTCLVAASPALGAEQTGVEWRLAQPAPPPPPPGVEQPPGVIGLGRIGDISFEAPNRGALITAGNPPAVPPGVWEYDGTGWHELSEVCGATAGRIAWAGPEEFWTISDGRPGQALVEGKRPPLEDDTLCRFSNPGHAGEPLQVMESFAVPAFQANSYQAMHAAACLSATDCWFAGNSLPSEAIDAGAFQLHWNGQALTEEPYPEEGHSVEDMTAFAGRLFESVRLHEGDRSEAELPRPPAIHAIDAEAPIFEGFPELPLYEGGEFPQALDFLHLAPGEEFLWAAAGPQPTPPESSAAPVTVLRGTNLSSGEGAWTQVVGPLALVNKEPFPGQTVTAIAAEPASESAWVGLDNPLDAERVPSPTKTATVARVSARAGEGIESEQTLPGARGAAWKIACPAPHDCWLATTAGWLYHLSSEQEETLEQDPDPAFQTLITERPLDQGLPQVPPDTLPPNDSGLPEGPPAETGSNAEKEQAAEIRATVPLLTHVHSRLVRGTTLELRFHLAVKARVRLIAKRAKQVVAATAMHTLKAGNRSLQLHLDAKRWPTKIALQTHPLAKLPTVPAGRGSNENTVSTSLAFPDLGDAERLGPLL